MPGIKPSRWQFRQIPNTLPVIPSVPFDSCESLTTRMSNVKITAATGPLAKTVLAL